MARYGFGAVPAQGFIGFAEDLAQSAWREVEVPEALRTPDGGGDLLAAPLRVAWKVQMMWALIALVAAESGALERLLEAADGAWDRGQRRLNLKISLAENSEDDAERDAAARLRHHLMRDGHLAQTNLSYEGEVDFGRRQVTLAAEPKLHADITRLDLIGALADVHHTTEALAGHLGRLPSQSASTSPAHRRRAAFSNCVTIFNRVLSEIDWCRNHPVPPSSPSLDDLRAPLLTLIERHIDDETPSIEPIDPASVSAPIAPSDPNPNPLDV